MYIVERLLRVTESYVEFCSGKCLTESFVGRIFHKHGTTLFFLCDKHTVHNRRNIVVRTVHIGSLLRQLCGEDYSHSVLPSLLYLLHVTQSHDLAARYNDNGERLAVGFVAHHEASARYVTAVVNHFWVNVCEVNAELVGEYFRHHVVVYARYVHSSLIVTFRSVKIMSGLHGGYRIHHRHISHMTSRTRKHVVETCKECVEVSKTVVVERITVRQFRTEGHIAVIIPHGMRYELVDTFGVLFRSNAIHCLHRYVAHVSVGLGHYVCLVPVVGRRRHNLIEMFGRTVAADLVDTRHSHILSVEHKVTGNTHGIHNFLLILMSGRYYAVCLSPIADGLHESFGVESRTQTKKTIACRCGLRAYIIPQSRIDCFWRKTKTLCKFLVEVISPHASIGTIHCGFVKERGGDGCSECLRETFVVGFMGILHKQTDCLLRQIVHVRIAVFHAHKGHNLPFSFFRYIPCKYVSIDMIPQ